MEAIFSFLTDEQRVHILNSVYQKGISTSKEYLAFSADKLIYLRPFISRLNNTNAVNDNVASRSMARQVIDELLCDIVEDIQANATNENAAKKVIIEYGLSIFASTTEMSYYHSDKVA